VALVECRAHEDELDAQVDEGDEGTEAADQADPIVGVFGAEIHRGGRGGDQQGECGGGSGGWKWEAVGSGMVKS